MAEPQWAIEARGLRKEFGAKVAVAGADLTVPPGEVFGFLGPNGAGKSTFIKMLLGLVHPSAGEAFVLGCSIREPEARRRVGFLPEHFSFPDWMRPAELLDLHGRLAGLPRLRRRERADELLALVGLDEARDRPLGAFSKGMLQRIGLAQALLSEPTLVILDEPTSGLDPLGRRLVRDVIRRLGQSGVTVFLNSHLLSEVELTCDRVAIIVSGTILRSLRLADQAGGAVLAALRVDRVDAALVEGLRRWADPIEEDGDGHTLTLHLADEAALPEIARWVVSRGVGLYALAPRRLSLEDLYVDYVHEGDA